MTAVKTKVCTIKRHFSQIKILCSYSARARAAGRREEAIARKIVHAPAREFAHALRNNRSLLLPLYISLPLFFRYIATAAAAAAETDWQPRPISRSLKSPESERESVRENEREREFHCFMAREVFSWKVPQWCRRRFRDIRTFEKVGRSRLRFLCIQVLNIARDETFLVYDHSHWMTDGAPLRRITKDPVSTFPNFFTARARAPRASQYRFSVFFVYGRRLCSFIILLETLIRTLYFRGRTLKKFWLCIHRRYII